MHGVATLYNCWVVFVSFSVIIDKVTSYQCWTRTAEEEGKPLLPAMANSHLKSGPASFQTSHYSHKHGANAMKESTHPKQPQCSHCNKIEGNRPANPTQKDMSFTSFPFCNPAVPGTTCPGPLFCSPVRNIVPRISLHDLPCHRTMRKCSRQVSLSLVAFLLLRQRFWIRTYSCNCPPYLCMFGGLFECNPNRHGQGTMSVLSNQRLSRVFSPLSRCCVSFQPVFMASTYTDKNKSFFSVNEPAFPIWNPSPNRVSIGFSQIAFPKIVLPKDDRTDFAQEERLGLRYWTMTSAICVVVDESKCLDIPILEFFNFCGASSIFTWYRADMRQLLVLRNLAVWRWYPWLLLLSFVMLMILAQWILHKILSHLSQCHLGARLDLCIFETAGPTPTSWDDRGPSTTQCMVLPLFLASAIISFFVSDFRQLPCLYFLEFFPSFSTAFASGIFIAWSTGINFAPCCCDSMNSSLFLQYGLHDSCSCGGDGLDQIAKQLVLGRSALDLRS